VANLGGTPADLEEGRDARCGSIVGLTYKTRARGTGAFPPHPFHRGHPPVSRLAGNLDWSGRL